MFDVVFAGGESISSDAAVEPLRGIDEQYQ
jgi:hypothetical protein